MIIVLCIIGWTLAIVAIALVVYLGPELNNLEKERDQAKLNERLAKSAMMVWIDKAQRLEKQIYRLSDNRCNECGRFLPKNQDGLCEVCAWAKRR